MIVNIRIVFFIDHLSFIILETTDIYDKKALHSMFALYHLFIWMITIKKSLSAIFTYRKNISQCKQVYSVLYHCNCDNSTETERIRK